MEADYIIGQTRAGKPIFIRWPVTIIENLPNGRTLVQANPNEFLHPNEQYEVWTSRLVLR